MPFATFNTQILQTASAVQGVTTSITQATTGIGRSASAVRNAAVSGVTNVGTGIISALPGVAAGVGSAAGAIAAVGVITGNSRLTAAASNIAVTATAAAGAVAALGQIAQSVKSIAGMLTGSGNGATSSSDGGGGGGGGGGGAGSNPLHAFASYTYMFRLSCLSDGEANGGARGMNVGRTIINMPNGDGAPYVTYIDNVRVSGVVGMDQTTGNSNAMSISFTVIEPHSMGKFWEAVQLQAEAAGHKNYATAPYQLAIRFLGHASHEAAFITVPNTDKFIHMKILDMQMKVTKRGTEYEINAYPWNEGGMSRTFNELKTDLTIQCDKDGPFKVKDLLKFAEKSMKKVLNDKLKDDKTRKQTVTNAHEIEICFPPPPGDSDSDGNEIGEADLGLNQYNRADTPFAKDGATYENGVFKRGNLSINVKNGDYKFAKGATVQDVINQVLLSSDYARKALENPGTWVNWWRVETRYHNISSEDTKTGEKAKKVIFRVVPYKVDAAKFFPPNTKTADPPPVRDLYWLYTGKNHDILDWNIDYKLAFYRAHNADGGANSDDKNLANRSSNAAPVRSGNKPPDTEPSGQTGPEVVRRDANQSMTGLFGGASFDDAATVAARQFHDIITKSYDMLNLELTILGDPFLLGDSGMGNFYVTDGSCMPWHEGEQYLKLTFRMPEDLNTDSGLYDFGGEGKPVREFSGYYKIQSVDSSFVRGKFTQKLQLIKKLGIVDAGGGQFPEKEPMPDSQEIYVP
jgi:hypothetical protein